ncbi:MAG: pectate lyase [Candidatus Pseudobacter hemicellulosilyticus]|uniref:Pectate lyase n=1 Tax=Candidatus Pseudobacter hemicellulosilyticus TaxID=3121375 RepID=A0AAJ5WPB7_9BACT|nr:MAG: pectate lyase [Pseudobacter sp.]
MIQIFNGALLAATLIVLSCAKKTPSYSIDTGGGDPTGTDKPVQVKEEPLAFPGAEGFGRDATGGRGGRVIPVTNLQDAGAGSLREAIGQSGPRIIVFSVSGTIELKSRLSIKNGDVTIAGQTAPGDGICLRNHDMMVDADNVIIRFLRFRMGDTEQVEGDALGGRFHKNIIVDHCSMSWSTDECVSFYANENFTLQWCLIAESLRNSVHGKGAHGYGGIWGGKKASFHHNLLAHHDSRNPRLGEEAGKAFALTDLVDLRNNVLYNWGQNSTYGGEAMNVNIVNCYYKGGPATGKSERIFSIDKNKVAGTEVYDTWGKFYIDGNFVAGSTRATQDNWTYGVFNQFHNSYGTVSESDKAAMRLSQPHPINNNVTTYTAEKAYEQVLGYVGASLKRDAQDTRIIHEVRTGTSSAVGSNGSINGIIDTQADAGGWPVLASAAAPKDTDGDGIPDNWETAHKLDPAVSNAGKKSLSTAYDDVEVYINSLVKELTEDQRK